MKKTFRHTGVLMMVGVFALGLLGAAYTLWYEDLTLEAHVSTGEFDVDWSCHDLKLQGTPDTEDCGEANVPDEGGDEEGLGIVAVSPDLEVFIPEGGNIPEAKYTQRCDAELGPETDTDDNGAVNGNTEILTLSMSGLYPYAGCRYRIDIHNEGTVPAHFTFLGRLGFDPGAGNLTPDSISVEFSRCQVSVASGEPLNDAVLDFDPETGLLVYADGGRPVQLHTSGRIWCDVDIWLHQVNAENSSAIYWATLTAHQWNEQPGIE